MNETALQIKRGSVLEGYKKTETGIIPVDWACAKLCEIADPITKTAGTDKYETLSISAGIGFVNQAEKFGKELSGKQYEKYIVLQKGDFSYNKGNSGKYPQGCIYRLMDRETAAVPNVFESFRLKGGYCPEFYDFLFRSGFMNKQLARKINHGVRDDGLLNLTDDDFYSTVLPVPSLAEQQKIAKILSTCDRLVERKQKLVEELQQLKKTCRAKMFPRNGVDVPELRFPGFTDSWKQRKLGELSERVIVGLATSVTPYYRSKGTPIFRNLNIKENYLDDSDILYLDDEYANGQTGKKIHTGDVLTVHTGYIGTSCVVPQKYDGCLTFTTLITTTDMNKLCGEFLSQYLNSEKGLSAVQMVTTQGGRQNLNTNDFVNVPITYPSTNEQIKICDVLRNIDSFITLHQREMEAEKQKKKALMQLLLTGIVRVKA